MAELKPLEFENFSEKVAESFMKASEAGGGLPGFLGIKLVEFGPGTLRAEAAVSPELLTPFGNIHGGVMAAICDHVLGCVCYPVMQKGQWAATTEFKLNYLAPVSKGTIVADARIISKTRSTMVVQIDVANEGRLCCCAQGTVLVRSPKAE
jgi:uncharacterized protein (TIGR00369 family)